jgi:DNA mismatch repair ATPase MutS
MYLCFYFVLLCSNLFGAPNLFNHATKQYTDYLATQSPEKAKIAQTITQAAKLIKDVEQSTEKKTEKEVLIDDKDVEIDEKTFDELRLFCAKNGSPFLEKINPKTSVGLVHLIRLLTKPTTDTEELKNRQKMIETLSNNPEFLTNLEQLLSELPQYESIFTSWSQDKRKPLSFFLSKNF